MALPNSDWAGPLMTALGMAGTWWAAQKFKVSQSTAQTISSSNTAATVLLHDSRLTALEEKTTRADERLRSIDTRTAETSVEVRTMSSNVSQLMGEFRANAARVNNR